MTGSGQDQLGGPVEPAAGGAECQGRDQEQSSARAGHRGQGRGLPGGEAPPQGNLLGEHGARPLPLRHSGGQPRGQTTTATLDLTMPTDGERLWLNYTFPLNLHLCVVLAPANV